MKNRVLLLLFVYGLPLCSSGQLVASLSQQAPPDTVKVGVYITSIHDIDFKQKEYALNLWLWLKYKNREFNFFAEP